MSKSCLMFWLKNLLFAQRHQHILLQSYKNIGQKIPPPKFLHFYAKIVKILAYMQNKCIFSGRLCMKK